MAGLSAVFGQIIVVFSLLGPCYNGCTVQSFFGFVAEELPLSLITLFLLGCAGSLYLLAVYLFVSIFSTKLQVKRWMYILLTIAITPMLLLALYGLVFDFADAIIYGPITLIASGILVLIWYPSWSKRTHKFSPHETLSN